MPRYRALFTGTIAAAVSAAVVLWPQSTEVTAAATNLTTYVYRVTGSAPQAEKLFNGGFDVLEQRDGNDLFVLGTDKDGARLKAAGFTGTVEQVLPPQDFQPQALPQAGVQDVNETYYGGYHTVNAQYSHLDQAATQHPDLVTNVTYGQSWRKSRGMANGYDLRAICITKKQTGDCALNPNSAKPRFFLMSQVHAREITTGDVSWRWIDYLVNGYSTDATVKALLDSTEMWVVPITNPDGVDIVQRGGNTPVLQRKNANNTNGSGCAGNGSSQIGVDLNRNTNSHWTPPASPTSRVPRPTTVPARTPRSRTPPWKACSATCSRPAAAPVTAPRPRSTPRAS